MDLARLPEDHEKRVPGALYKRGDFAGHQPVHVYNKYNKRLRTEIWSVEEDASGKRTRVEKVADLEVAE